MRRRRVGIVSGVLLAMVVSTTGCGKSKGVSIESNEYTVKVGYAKGLCHAPIHIAYENGFFKEQGVNVEIIPVGSANMADALASGQIDAGFGLVGKFVQPLENGLNMKITSGIHTGCMKLVVPSDSAIQNVADLKGKRIGVVSLADSPCLTTKRSLASEGIGVTADNLEVEFVVYSAADLPVALQNGAIDAFADADPSVSIAQREYNLRAIIDTASDEKYKDEYCCVSFVSSELAGKNEELASKFTRAVQEASVWVEDHPDETAKLQIEKEYVAGDLQLNQELLESYKYIPSGKGGYDALETTVKDLQRIGILKESTDALRLIEDSFVQLDGIIE